MAAIAEIHVPANIEILKEEATTPVEKVPATPLDGKISWISAQLRPEDGLVTLSAAAIDEIISLVDELRKNPLPIEFLAPEMFHLPECVKTLAEASEVLSDGVGFVIIDRLPLDKISRDEAKKVYWVLMQMISRPVAQSWDGKMLYDVRDTGREPGNGVRPDVTNAEQNFHTDNSYNLCPPDYVSLLCLQKAKEGGVSSIISFQAVFNELLRRHPELVKPLFSSYLFDRQMEHDPDAPRVLSHPVLQMENGRLVCRLSYRHVINGHRMAGVEMSDEQQQALETFETIMREPAFFREFYFQPGQIQIVDNKRLGHRRTGFVDFPEEDRKRHLVRLWLRHDGRRFYNG